MSFCATFHLSTQLQKRKKYINGSDCNQKGRRQWKSQAHSLHLFPVLSEIDTSNTSRMTFTKSQSNRENANQVHRVLWRHKLRKELELNVRLKQLQKLLRKQLRREPCSHRNKQVSYRIRTNIYTTQMEKEKTEPRPAKKHKDQPVIIVSCVFLIC